MNKLAIFVEGQTEAAFIERLIVEIIGEKKISIDYRKRLSKKYYSQILKGVSPSNQNYYVLITDCGSDGAVKTAISEFFKYGSGRKYDRVLGLRDVHPIKPERLSKLEAGLKAGLPPSSKILLAIQEIESWFIAENSHFLKIDSRLTKEHIQNSLQLDVAPDKVENIYHPYKVLNDILRLVGKKYSKKKWVLNSYIYFLDYAELYLKLPQQVPSLENLVSELDQFFDR